MKSVYVPPLGALVILAFFTFPSLWKDVTDDSPATGIGEHSPIKPSLLAGQLASYQAPPGTPSVPPASPSSATGKALEIEGKKVHFAHTHLYTGRKEKTVGFREQKLLKNGLRFLEKERERLGLTPEDIQSTVLTDGYTSGKNQVTHLYLQQQHSGIGVWNGIINLNLKDGEVFYYGNRFVPDLARQANRTEPVITSEEALAVAADYFDVELNSSTAVLEDWGGAAQEKLYGHSGISLENIPAKLVYHTEQGSNSATLAWNLVVRTTDRQACWDMCIDAETGKVLAKANWVSCFQCRVVPMPIMAPNDPGNSSPGNDSRLLVGNPDDPDASPLGWFDDDGLAGDEYTDTRGNNVWAQEDADNDDTDGYRPDGGAGANFDFDSPIDFASESPADYRDAVITNLFYWNNLCHDVFWHYGFDEAAGNFQNVHFGSDGIAGDHVEADGLDGGGTDNANFFTPPDGSNPRMQMFEHTSTNPRRPSSFDNGIIVHEYGHGVSNRLTGGPGNSSALNGFQSSGMGEGWSDFLGIVLTAKASDSRSIPRPVGTYVNGEDAITGAGIRPAPYSPDMTVNDLTYGSLNGGGLSIPHGYGTVWCTVLWDLFWDFVDVHGFDSDVYRGNGGNNMVLQLVMDGMKLQPSNPSFLDARDALLAADYANHAGANKEMIWAAFARRGMGYSALDDEGFTAPVEAFDLPPNLGLDTFEDLIATGAAGGPFSPVSKTYILTNEGNGNINWTATRQENWLTASPQSGALAPGDTVTVTVSINGNAAQLDSGIYEDLVAFTDTTNSSTQTRNVVLRVDIDDYTESFDGNDNDLDHVQLTFTPGSDGYDLCRTENAISELPHAPGVNVLELGDDAFEEVHFTDGKSFSYGGSVYSSVFIGSNGYLTFGSGDTRYGTLERHFSMPRISLGLRDLNPTLGSGAVSWSQLGDRFVVTYENVEKFGGGNPNTWQAELYFDGRIRLSWLETEISDGVVGLSLGQGFLVGFMESDLTEYSSCTPPDPLVVSPESAYQFFGPEGGPFLQSARIFTVENIGSSAADWAAVLSASWVNLVSSGVSQLGVAAVTASVSEGSNTASNVNDGNLDTRWSGEGIGQYLTFELTQETTLDEVRIAFEDGNERTASFRVAVSTDGVNYNVVRGDSESSGTSNALQIFEIAGSPFASHVRIIGLGNSVNDWNSYTEVELFGSSAATSGTLSGSSSTTVGIELTPAAASLEVGTHTTTFTLTNLETGYVHHRSVSIHITDPLRVAPTESIVITGPVGGPFTPDCTTFTLANEGAQPVSWTLSESTPWLTAATSAGSLGPGGTVTVDVCLSPSAIAMSEGVYQETITFTNSTSGEVKTSDITLRIGDSSTERFTSTNPFDLTNTQLIFSQIEGQSYRVCHQEITEFPQSIAEAVEITLEDDDSYEIVFSEGVEVSFFGQKYGSLYVGSNGYLTFGQDDTDFSGSLEDHFSLPRISFLFDDLDPTDGDGKVYWQELSDRIVVTFDGILEFSGSSPNEIQIEVFLNGNIRISYLGVSTGGCYVGVSDGNGLPTNFLETDFSATDVCSQRLALVPVDYKAQEMDSSNEAVFTLTRIGPTIEPLTVYYSTGGTAILGTDYEITAMGGSLVIPVGESAVDVRVSAVDDAVAEGEETVDFKLVSNAAYELSGESALTLVIEDHPIDAWRFAKYGGNAPGSGDLEDSDGDGIVALMEYALGTDPQASDPFPILVDFEKIGGIDYLTLTYTRDLSLEDIRYEVQTCKQLEKNSWTTLGVSEEVLSFAGTQETCKAHVLRSDVRRFLRLEVTRIR